MDQSSRSPEHGETATPNWNRWASFADVVLYEAVALSCNLDPEGRDLRSVGDLEWFQSAGPADAMSLALHLETHASDLRASVPEDFLDRMIIAANNARAGTLRVTHQFASRGKLQPRVSLAEFARWAAALPIPWEMPGEFPRPVLPAPSWPWGHHETALLRTLAQVGRKYFGGRGTEAPQKKALAAEIREIDPTIAERTADVMAKLLCG